MSSPCGYCYGTGRRKLRFQKLVPHYCHSEGCLPCAKLAKIQIDINAARVALNKLLEERDTIANEFNKAHDPLSQSQLPVEVTKEVFKFCLPLQPSLNVFDRMSDYRTQEFDEQIEMLLTLGRVNRRWRLITNTTSDLWKVLPLNFTPQRCYDRDVLETWLDRSQQQSLFLWIGVVWSDRVPGYSNKTCSILDALHPHYDRVKLLALDAFNPAYLTRNDASKLPNLQKLYIMQRSYWRTFTSSPLYIDAAPRVLCLFGGVKNIRINRWDELQQLEITEISIVSFLRVLENSPKLQSCKATGVFISQEESVPIAVEHQSLKFLDLSAVCSEFWTTTSFPSLRELIIDLAYGWLGLEHIGDFVRPCRQLEGLCIKSDKAHFNRSSPQYGLNLLHVLEQTSSLKTLRLTNIPIHDQFFRANFLPLLEDVHIEYGHCDLVESDLIVRFLKQRCAAEYHGHLTRFHIEQSQEGSSAAKSTDRYQYYQELESQNYSEEVYSSLMDAACGIDLVIRDYFGRYLVPRGIEAS